MKNRKWCSWRLASIGMALSLAFAPLSFADLSFKCIGSFPANIASPTPMVQGPDGAFYGVSGAGGDNERGVIYRYDPLKGCSVLHSFPYIAFAFDPNNGGACPTSKLLLGPDGTLYGTTMYGGMFGVGTIFKIDPNGSLTTLHDFLSYEEGGQWPCLSLVTPEGDIYGFSRYGGTTVSQGEGSGVIFRVDRNGRYSIVYQFPTSYPIQPSSLVLGADGHVYGTTGWYTSLFRIDGDGQLSFIKCWFSYNDYSLLFADPDGGFIGSGPQGLVHISYQGELSPIYKLNSSPDEGGYPENFLLGGDGAIYWSTRSGGANFAGSLNRVTRDGQYSLLYSFPFSTYWQRNGICASNDGYIYTLSAGFDDAQTSGSTTAAASLLTRSMAPQASNASLTPLTSLSPLASMAAQASTPPKTKRSAWRLKAPDLPSGPLPPVTRDDSIAWSSLKPATRGGKRLREKLIPVLANDKDPQKFPLSVVSVTQPAHGAAEIDPATNRVWYRTESPLPINDEFTYTVGDGNGVTSSAKVAILASNKGVYQGDLGGAVSMTVTTNGTRALNGSVVVGGVAYRFSGGFNASGRFIKRLAHKAGSVELVLYPSADSWSMAATVTSAAGVSTGTLARTPSK